MPDRGTGPEAFPILWFGVCVDNDDPLRAGRIRAVADESSDFEHSKYTDPTGQVNAETLTATTASKGTTEKYEKWSKQDPFVFTPFLPLHLNIVPKINDFIKIIKFDPTANATLNREYIGPVTSMPHKLDGDAYHVARMWSSMGGQIAVPQGVDMSCDSDGVFAHPNDVAIYGRNNTDVVFGMSDRLPKETKKDESRDKKLNCPKEKEDSLYIETDSTPQILIRSGKFKLNDKEYSPQPEKNPKMTFIQLNTFPNKLTIKEDETQTLAELQDDKLNVLFEYDILPGEDPIDFLDPLKEIRFRFNIALLPNRGGGTTNNIMCSKLGGGGGTSGLEANFSFTETLVGANLKHTPQKMAEELKVLLGAFDEHDFVTLLGDMTGATSNPTYGFNPVSTTGLERKISSLGLKSHPLYFRPGQRLVNFMMLTQWDAPQFSSYASIIDDPTFQSIKNSIIEFVDKVTLNGVKEKGYGLAFTRNADKRQIPTKSREVKQKKPILSDEQEGFLTCGSEKIYLLSHNSQIAGTPPFKLNSNYGISHWQYADKIEKSTNSLVRGEKLLDLLDMIVEFTLSHAHQPGKAPCSISWGGTSSSDIQNKLLKAREEVLNKNIRIN
jgi:hypothetical protein